MHSKERELIIKILFYKNNLSKSDFTHVNYENFVQLASSMLMIPSIYLNLKKTKYINLIEDELKKYLKGIYNINFNRNKKLLNEIEQISKFLTKNEIKHVFLKGSALIIGEYYSDIGERMINDIDILVEEKNIKKAERLMKEFSYYPFKNYIFFSRK